MKTLKEQAFEYARQYPEEVRNIAAKSWMDGRKSAKKKDKLDLCFVEDKYRDIFEYWLNYKKERKQTYTQSGAEACYRKLIELSGGDKNTMIAIIEQSCANNWAGLFELKNDNGRNNQNRGQDTATDTNVFTFSNQVCEERERQYPEHNGRFDY